MTWDIPEQDLEHSSECLPARWRRLRSARPALCGVGCLGGLGGCGELTVEDGGRTPSDGYPATRDFDAD